MDQETSKVNLNEDEIIQELFENIKTQNTVLRRLQDSIGIIEEEEDGRVAASDDKN